jgi:hypothetical protein
MRVPPPADQVGHRDAVRGDRSLRQQAEHAGDVDTAHLVHRAAVE